MSEENNGAAAPPPPAAADWWASRPEEWKSAPHMGDVTDSAGALKAIQDMANYQGQSIRIPTDSATPEMWDEFKAKLSAKVPGVTKIPDAGDLEGQKTLLKSLGVPEAAEGYSAVEGIPDEALAALRARSLELGHTPAQYEAEAQSLAAELKAESDKAAQDKEANLQALKNAWGNAEGEKWDAIAEVLRATEAPDTLIAQAKAGEIDPALVRWMERVSDLAPANPGGQAREQAQSTGITPSDAQNQLHDVESQLMDVKNPIRGPQKKALMLKRLELQYQAAGRPLDDPEYLEIRQDLRDMSL